jgi:hypothetical protein
MSYPCEYWNEWVSQRGTKERRATNRMACALAAEPSSFQCRAPMAPPRIPFVGTAPKCRGRRNSGAKSEKAVVSVRAPTRDSPWRFRKRLKLLVRTGRYLQINADRGWCR